MITLQNLFDTYGMRRYVTDKSGKGAHTYLSVYDDLFYKFKEKEINILEIGVGHGGGLKLFEDYFTKAQIRGIDISPILPEMIGFPFDSDRVKLFINDIKLITKEWFNDFPPDIVIEDGSHYLRDQLHTIKLIMPLLRDGGILIIEDVIPDKERISAFNATGYDFDLIDMNHLNGGIDNVLAIFYKQ